MPKSMTKTRPAAESVAATLDETFTGMTADAIRLWRSWATAVADGDRSPAEPRQMVEVALTLGIRDPGSALAKDAEAIAGVRMYEARRQAGIEADAKRVADLGGRQAIVERQKALEEELRQLRAALAYGGSFAASEWQRAAAKIRRETPRIFDVNYQGEPSR